MLLGNGCWVGRLALFRACVGFLSRRAERVLSISISRFGFEMRIFGGRKLLSQKEYNDPSSVGL